MPRKSTVAKARQAKREGKAPTTQAGEFVHEEIEHVREGKHGARSAKQAIAIGLSKARRAGVKVPAKAKKGGSKRTAAKRSTAKRTTPKRSTAKRATPKRTSRARSLATTRALKREGKRAASKGALSRQARSAARARGQKTHAPKTSKRPVRRTRSTAKRTSRSKRAS
ncbi:DUF6496 domain-containing protein [Pendulispora rubella]|uniref:DUF6496 domain-containing protein n=1 Tax=Pendulispora rubella TaxID=2741070 RepID=A0ABZ2LFB0_9BACT